MEHLVKRIAGKIFGGRCGNKDFRRFSEFLRKYALLLHPKLPKTSTILSFFVFAVIFYAVGVFFLDILVTKFGVRKVLTECSILKNSFLHQDIFDKIASRLAIYDAKVEGDPLEFIRLGKNNDGGYVVPVAAIESADVLMGYGIGSDISFEREFSQRFNKPSFGFDCGVQNIETGDDRCHFFSECIGNSNHLMESQISSGQIYSFSDQLQRFGLTNKKIFIKMDIEGAEFDVINDILRRATQVTGIVLEVHTPSDNPAKTWELLSSLDEHFVLVHLHGTNISLVHFKTKYAKNCVPSVLELTYINKNLLSSYEISKNQKHPRPIDQPDCVNIPECEFEIIPSSLRNYP